MIKKMILPVLTTLALIAPISVYGLPLTDPASLAKQCRTVSQKLAQISLAQSDHSCISILEDAVIDTESAAKYLEHEAYHAAKNHLHSANNGLKYAIIIGCENSLEIDVAKNELLEINGLIIDDKSSMSSVASQ